MFDSRPSYFPTRSLLAILIVGTAAPALFGQQLTSTSATTLVIAEPKAVAVQEPVSATVVIRGTHKRLIFEKDVTRTAMGNPDTMNQEVLSSREILLLGKEIGRTSLIVWFEDGTFGEFLFVVEDDLTLLKEAMKSVHPNIEVAMAPDREAIILQGTVPDISYSMAAEDVANRYLDATGGTSGAPALIGASGEGEAPDIEASEQEGGSGGAGSVINLLKLDVLPLRPEEKMLEGILSVGGENVTIRRITVGLTANDEDDIFVLEGTVAHQVALMRVLTVASQVIAGETDVLGNIEVLADESGALAGSSQVAGGASGSGASSGGSAGLTGGSSAQSLRNRVQSNIARAKAIELADGRILSFITVTDIPQVRVGIKIYQINRTKLRSFGSDLSTEWGDHLITRADPPSAGMLDGDIPGTDNVYSGVLESLSGNMSTEFLLATDRFILDSVLSMLESRDIARSLSSPSLMVLSGEVAFFQVGGQIPIPVNFSPAFGGEAGGANGSTPGVFNSVQFAEFGVQLGVRPLVDENDVITLDVTPSVANPDTGLTAAIRDSTGTAQSTVSFETRSLRTSARLEDGQSLLIGGLVRTEANDGDTKTPGIGDAPIIGNLFGGFTRTDDELELIILVNPVIVRDKVQETALWAFPGGPELLVSAGLAAAPPPESEPKPLLE